MSVLERFAQIRALVQITFTRFRNSYPALHLLTKDSRHSRVGTLDTGFKIAGYEIDYATAASRLCFSGNGAIEAVLFEAESHQFRLAHQPGFEVGLEIHSSQQCGRTAFHDQNHERG